MSKKPEIEEFKKACDKYDKGTNLLKFIVIYYLPFFIICTVLMSGYFFNNANKYSKQELIILFAFQFIFVCFLIITRKAVIHLTKKGYYYLFLAIGGVCVQGVLVEGLQTIPIAIMLFCGFILYLSPREFLFNSKK